MQVKSWLIIVVGILYWATTPVFSAPEDDSRVQKVYSQFSTPLLWVKGQQIDACGKQLIEALLHVDDEGLWQDDYTPLVSAIKSQDLSTPQGQEKADKLLTLGALNYISDMKGERLNPRKVGRTIHIKQVNINEAELLTSYLSLPNNCAWIHNLAPSTLEYQDIKEELALYRQKKAQGGWPTLPKGTTLKEGAQGPLVETLKEQLIAQDALPSSDAGGDIYDERIVEAVKKYQKLHGLEVDGWVGPNSLIALNTSVDERIRSLIVSLERQRWLPNPLPSRYIQVNIVGFYLKAVEGNHPRFFMPIITGKAYTKTPVFNADMNEVTFNPSWYVPASIVSELMPSIRKNPAAFRAKGYRWSGNKIIQGPGSANALGKIRFNIVSPFSIFLHGTPNKALFEKSRRSFSHGCIRVQNPPKLAEFVFDNPEIWPLSRIEQDAKGTRTKRVKLDRPVPTFITYFTVFEDENGDIHFVEDLYGQDSKVWKALERARRKNI